MTYFISVLTALTIVICTHIVVVPQSKAYVVQRLGLYFTTWEAGLHLKLPLVDKIVSKCSRKEQVYDLPESEAVTKDDVRIRLDAVIYFYVFDPERYAYGIEDPYEALRHLCTASLRNCIGSLTFDECLTAREMISNNTKDIIDEAAESWGIQTTRIEIKNIFSPQKSST